MRFLAKTHRGKGGEVDILVRPDWSSFDPAREVAEFKELTRRYRKFVARIMESPKKPGFNRLVRAFEAFDEIIALRVETLSNLYSAMRTPAIEAAEKEIDRLAEKLSEYFYGHPLSYRAYRAFRQTREYKKLDKEEKTAFDLALGSFAAAGRLLRDGARRRYDRYSAELERLARDFERNLTRSFEASAVPVENAAELAGIPERVVARMRQEAARRGIDGWVALPFAEFRVPILRLAEHRPLREALWRAWVTAASEKGGGGKRFDNRPNIERQLLLRYRVAAIRGYPNYAQFVTSDYMAGSAKRAHRFLMGIARTVSRNARNDLRKIEKFARAVLGHELEPWDLEFAKQRYARSTYGFLGDDMADFITLDGALATLFRIAKDEFGVRIVPIDDARGWHPSVRFFEVYEHGGRLSGGFYLDPFARTGAVHKSSEEFWAQPFSLRRRIARRKVRVPVSILHCNFPEHEDVGGTMLSHDDLILLFHEFGHVLGYTLAKSNFRSTGPTEIEEDVKEVVSMFMENYAWDVEILEEVVRRSGRRRRLPLKILLALHRQRPLWSSIGRYSHYEYLERSLIDLELNMAKYDRLRPGFVERVVCRVRKNLGVLPHPELDRFPNNYEIIFGGGYESLLYTYLWSWRLAAAIRQVHLKSPHGSDPLVSRRLRREIIEASRTRCAKENITAFFGTKVPSARAMLEFSRVI